MKLEQTHRNLCTRTVHETRLHMSSYFPFLFSPYFNLSQFHISSVLVMKHGKISLFLTQVRNQSYTHTWKIYTELNRRQRCTDLNCNFSDWTANYHRCYHRRQCYHYPGLSGSNRNEKQSNNNNNNNNTERTVSGTLWGQIFVCLSCLPVCVCVREKVNGRENEYESLRVLTE